MRETGEGGRRLLPSGGGRGAWGSRGGVRALWASRGPRTRPLHGKGQTGTFICRGPWRIQESQKTQARGGRLVTKNDRGRSSR